MWSIEAVIARHEAGLTTDSERVAMEEERAAAAVASGVPPGAGGTEEASRGMAGATTMKVVAAVDASEESLRALSWALDHVVRQNPGASVVVVHAHRAEHFVYPVAAHGILRRATCNQLTHSSFDLRSPDTLACVHVRWQV
jgi:hypothetical protein